MDIEKLKSKLSINEHALDVALREHPDLFYHVAEELALAISRRDEAKQQLDETVSFVDMELRRQAAVSEEKVTEKTIESQRNMDRRVRDANTKLLDLKYEAAKWAALREAYESRSYALSKLVDLYLANYFATNQETKTGSNDFRSVRAERIKKELATKRRVSS